MSKPNKPSDRVDSAVQERLRSALIDFRKRRGLSRTKFAERAGMSLWMISMFENGDRFMSLEGALRLCHAMDIKLWKLLKDVEE